MTPARRSVRAKSSIDATALPVGVQVLGPVVGLDQAVFLGPCLLGHPGRQADLGPLVLGPGTVIRAGAILYQGSSLGAGAQVGHNVLIREDNVIGERSSVGSGSQLEPGNRIGSSTRIHSGCFLASATVGDGVFIGPHVTFTDDPHPPCPDWPRCRSGVVVEDGVSIGGGVTLLPGITIGRGALIGGGSVVTRTVAPGVIVAGNPARERGLRTGLECQGPRTR